MTVRTRVTALVHTLGRCRWLERSNLTVACAVAVMYLEASNVSVNPGREQLATLADELNSPTCTAGSIALFLRTWKTLRTPRPALRDPVPPSETSLSRSRLCGSKLEEFRNALGVLVGMEAGEQIVDKLHAAWCSDVTCQKQGLGGGGCGGLGFLEVEVACGAVGEKHPAGLVPGRGQQAFAFGDELVGAGGVAEVQEGLAGVDGEVGFGYPGTPGGPVGTDIAQVFLRCGKGAQHGASFAAVALCGEGAGEA